MKKIPRMTAAVLLIALLLSLAGCGASDGKTHLTFQIWDTAQRKGMEQMCDAYVSIGRCPAAGPQQIFIQMI